MGSGRKIGIATLLTLVFSGLVAVSTGTLLAVSLTNAVDTTREALTARVADLLDEAMGLSEAFYKPVEFQARWLADDIQTGHITPGLGDEFRGILYGASADNDQISGISFQRPDGTGYFYEAETGILQDVEWPRRWRIPLNPSAEGPQTWPPQEGTWVLRPSVLDGTRLGTFIAPVRGPDGQDTGAIAIRRNSIPLARAFAADASFRNYELVRFMLFNERDVIGHPELATMPKTSRPSVDDLKDPFLKEIATARRQPVALLDDIQGAEGFRIETGAGSRVMILRPVPDYTAGGTLLVGVHFDPAAGAPELNRIVSQAAIGAALLLGAILFAIWLGRRASAPVWRLATAAELVQGERLEDVEPLPVGPVRELATASGAFNSMVVGLKERERIRNLFGKYVPEDVAALLVSDDDASQPRNAMATVLFLDIAGFSALSERVAPAELVETMNAFFSDAVQSIEAGGGMVAQFQGDALLAVFNVPIPRDDHADAAVQAALSILDTVDDKLFGGNRLACRIGINTGEVVAGAIGAQDRLSYTVYGDTVNVAARLESLNKELGTRLLIAASTAEKVQNAVCEQKGEITVRGRQAPVSVYSVTGTNAA
ncbi:MAG: adenylate/guanylate cyclase domain-containing protein [Pseudomonadota bacterium]